MEKTKKQVKSEEIQVESETKQVDERVPMGFVARTATEPAVFTTQNLFDLMKIAEVLSNLSVILKQENLEKDVLRYYYKEDLVDAVDKEGKVIMNKGVDGKDVPQKTLKPDFWN